MKKLLAFMNWPPNNSDHNNMVEDFNPLLPTGPHHSRPNPEEETQPMVRIGNRDPLAVQKAIDLAG